MSIKISTMGKQEKNILVWFVTKIIWKHRDNCFSLGASYMESWLERIQDEINYYPNMTKKKYLEKYRTNEEITIGLEKDTEWIEKEFEELSNVYSHKRYGIIEIDLDRFLGR